MEIHVDHLVEYNSVISTFFVVVVFFLFSASFYINFH